MRLLITAAILLILSIPAQAAHRSHTHHNAHRHVSTHKTHQVKHIHSRRGHRHNHLARYLRHQHEVLSQRHGSHGATYHGGGIVTVQTAVGRITVASHLAGRFQALIADFVAHGYHPRHVGCFANGGHVEHSRHYAGAACDFDQRGWGLTTSFMYHAHAIIARHGFRDGCSFNDCGHVDDGLPLHTSRYAYAHHRHEHGHRSRYAQRRHGRQADDS